MDLGDIELTLTPISGKSGKAYMGSYPDGKRVFIKMNTSPILPGLAREQIAPQLLWSRRLPDGRDMSAQEWLFSRTKSLSLFLLEQALYCNFFMYLIN